MKLVARLLVMLAVLASCALSSANELAEREAFKKEFIDAFRREEFARIDVAYATFLANGERQPGGRSKVADLLRALKNSVEPPPNQDMALSALEREGPHWAAMEKKALRWLERNPGSTPAAYTLSYIHVGRAFMFRGERFASEVDPEQWKPWDLSLDNAHEVLNTPQILAKKDLAWYAARISLARYRSPGPEETARLIMDGSRKYPDLEVIYHSGTGAFDPKWGGSVEALDWIANLAAARSQKTLGLGLYTLIYWDLAVSNYPDNLFTATRVDWNKMKAGFVDLNRRYPSVWTLNRFAWFACTARDQVTLKGLFEKIGTGIEPEVWRNTVRLNRCKSFARDGD